MFILLPALFFAVALCQNQNMWKSRSCPNDRTPPVIATFDAREGTECSPSKLRFCQIKKRKINRPADVGDDWLTAGDNGLLACGSRSDAEKDVGICFFPYSISSGGKCTFDQMCTSGYCALNNVCTPHPCGKCKHCIWLTEENKLKCFDTIPTEGKCLGGHCAVGHACVRGQCAKRPEEGKPCLGIVDHCFEPDWTCRCGEGLICLAENNTCVKPSSVKRGSACDKAEPIAPCGPKLACVSNGNDPNSTLGVCRSPVGPGDFCDAQWTDMAAWMETENKNDEQKFQTQQLFNNNAGNQDTDDEESSSEEFSLDPDIRFGPKTFTPVRCEKAPCNYFIPCYSAACFARGGDTQLLCSLKEDEMQCKYDEECVNGYCSQFGIVKNVNDGVELATRVCAPPSRRPLVDSSCNATGVATCDSDPTGKTLLICNSAGIWTPAFTAVPNQQNAVLHREECNPLHGFPLQEGSTLRCADFAATTCLSDSDCVWGKRGNLVDLQYLGYPQGTCDCTGNKTVGRCRWMKWWSDSLVRCSQEWKNFTTALHCGKNAEDRAAGRNLWLDCLTKLDVPPAGSSTGSSPPDGPPIRTADDSGAPLTYATPPMILITAMALLLRLHIS
eukprot:TRINITY_DN61569_c0_g2_i1.p1 TRINITY_DN61569_c0_g2~~TRINITY_DN61569_c0_g2_i1.p1  ORF type:complete len:614 (-),score=24.65 TRINITY_DN61569_c0_g2_i1:96-1937(-)